jgi:hypothetical protein
MSKASLAVTFPLTWAGFWLDPVLESAAAARPATATKERNQRIVLFMPCYVVISLPLGGAGHKNNLDGYFPAGHDG